MNKRQKLGQHYLRDTSVLKRIIKAAGISKEDIVFEIGAGTGDLTDLLCSFAKKVISIKHSIFKITSIY
jgi:16S rRNA (adenine1518-N6/adenine1519-N6)-dimethyltransferase